MPYKDKDRQRRAVREATRRYRAKGITQGITDEGITKPDSPKDVIPKQSYNPMMAGYEPPKEPG